MKKSVALIFTVLMVIALCVSMVACGGGVEGTYKFSSMKMNLGGISMTVEADKPTTIMGTEMTIGSDSITITINKDNTFVMKGELMGENMEQKGTWESKDGKILLTADNETVEATINGKTLTMQMEEGVVVTYKK